MHEATPGAWPELGWRFAMASVRSHPRTPSCSRITRFPGGAGSTALDDDGIANEEAVAECPVCHKEIISTVHTRLHKVQLLAEHFPCGGWYRGPRGIKKDEPGYYKSKLPGTWTLLECEDEPGKYQTMGAHLAPLGLAADTPLIFTKRSRGSQ